MNEADTCRMLVRPMLESEGWDESKHFYSEQTAFTDGRIIVPAGKPRRLKKKFSDFLLRYTRDVTLAVVKAKSNKKPAGNGLQQAKDYANILSLKFAYATNGSDIIECDFFTSIEKIADRYPAPTKQWHRYQHGLECPHSNLMAFFCNQLSTRRLSSSLSDGLAWVNHTVNIALFKTPLSIS
jgi:type I restriction enzyme R subunit